MKRIQRVVFVLAVAVLLAVDPESSRAFGAFDSWVSEAETNCDGGYGGPDEMPGEPTYYAQCNCQSGGCNDYVTQDWAGQAEAACDEFCSELFCGIHSNESFFSGGSYFGYAICNCFPKCEGEPPHCGCR